MLRVSSCAVDAASVEHCDVGVGVEDSRWRSLSRNSEREAGHDRVVPVRPLIHLDHLVPVLGLVYRHAHIEARCRHEHPVRALVGPLHTVLRLEGCASPEHAAYGRTRGAGARKTQASTPGSSQVRLPVGQSGRRRCRRVSLRSPAAATALSKPALHDRGRTDENKDCRRGARENARAADSLLVHRNPHFPAFRTLSGTGMMTYIWPISVTFAFTLRTTVPFRRSTMVPAYNASILNRGLFQSAHLP